MPGILFHGKKNGMPDPTLQVWLLAKSMNGTGTPPAAPLRAGDLVAYTTKSTLTANTVPVMRPLLAADRTAHYKEGTPVAGILGVAMDDASTDSAGQPLSPAAPGTGGFPLQFGMNFYNGADPVSGFWRGRYLPALPGNLFKARLDINATDFTGAVTVGHQFDGLTSGFTISASSGVTTYRFQAPLNGPGVNGGTGAAALDQCIVCIGPDTSDPLWNTAITASGAVGAGALGPYMIFEFLGAFCQQLTGVTYATQ